MNKILKNIKANLPRNVKEIIKYFLYFFYRDKKIFKKNIHLKNQGNNKRAFLIATGPSINDFNLKKLRNEDCFTISNAYLHQNIKEIEPIYHFFIPYHKPLIKRNYIDWLKNSDSVLPERTNIFLSHKSKKMIEENNLFNNREVNYMYFGNPFFYNIDLTKQVPTPQTGPHMILNLLLYMDYDEIYLMGCDHNLLKNYYNNREHFYSDQREIRKNANYWSEDITEHLQAELKMFNIYKKYYNTANKKNIKIFNCSEESWLKFIEYKNFNDLNI